MKKLLVLGTMAAALFVADAAAFGEEKNDQLQGAIFKIDDQDFDERVMTTIEDGLESFRTIGQQARENNALPKDIKVQAKNLSSHAKNLKTLPDKFVADGGTILFTNKIKRANASGEGIKASLEILLQNQTFKGAYKEQIDEVLKAIKTAVDQIRLSIKTEADIDRMAELSKGDKKKAKVYLTAAKAIADACALFTGAQTTTSAAAQTTTSAAAKATTKAPAATTSSRSRARRR